MRSNNPVNILIAEDDDDDFFLAEEALKEARVLNTLNRVGDGEELLKYLKREGKYSEAGKYPFPKLILLDLNMPKMDGREALKEIKEDKELRKIPVVIMTTSKEEEDIVSTYNLGSNSYIRKPVSFDGFIDTMKALGAYWFEVVELPPAPGEDDE